MGGTDADMRSRHACDHAASDVRGLRVSTHILTTVLMLMAVAGLTACGTGATLTSGSTDEPGPPAAQAGERVKIPGVASCRAIAASAGSAVGPASDGLDALRLPCLTSGPAVDISALRGRPVLVNLWASWCGPCREEMPLLQAAYERFGKHVQFVGVDTRDGPPAADFLQQAVVTYPQLADPNGDLLNQLRIPGLPVTLLLGPDGSIMDRHVGAFQGTELDDLLARTLHPNG